MRLARQPGIDHHAHAGQGDAGFGDVGGQHHAPAAIVRGLQHAGLRFHRQVAVQGEHVDAGGCRHVCKRAFGLPDLADAGQEDQHVAGMCRQRVLECASQLRRQRLVAPRRKMGDIDRESCARCC